MELHEKPEHTATLPPEPKESMRNSVLDFLKFAVLALIVVAPIRLFIAQPFIVSGASMVPTFDSGHYLIIDELSYRFEEPKRGEVIVFRFPFEGSKYLIKRVVGLPDETVILKGSTVVIKNDAHPEGFLWEQGDISEGHGRDDLSVTLEKDQYFVLGDNRGESADSRLWGPLERKHIVGRPLLRLLPISQVGVFPGAWETAETDNQPPATDK